MQNEVIHTSQANDTNPLYVRMRNRFDFSGNRTIGEFMMMKASREGFSAPESPENNAKPNRFNRTLASLAAFLLSGSLLLFGGIRAADSIGGSNEEPETEPTPINAGITVDLLTDRSAIEIVFPNEADDMTIEE